MIRLLLLKGDDITTPKVYSLNDRIVYNYLGTNFYGYMEQACSIRFVPMYRSYNQNHRKFVDLLIGRSRGKRFVRYD